MKFSLQVEYENETGQTLSANKEGCTLGDLRNDVFLVMGLMEKRRGKKIIEFGLTVTQPQNDSLLFVLGHRHENGFMSSLQFKGYTKDEASKLRIEWMGANYQGLH